MEVIVYRGKNKEMLVQYATFTVAWLLVRP